jgi:hypothetical protein
MAIDMISEMLKDQLPEGAVLKSDTEKELPTEVPAEEEVIEVPEPAEEPVIEEPEEPETEELTEEEINEFTRELFDGLTYEEVRQRLETPAANELEFENDFQKQVYEFAKKLPNVAVEQSAELLSTVLFTNPETLEDKALLELEFRLANPDLTPSEAKVLFKRKFDKEYPDFDLDELDDADRILYKRELNRAKTEINKFKEQNLAKVAPKVETQDTKAAEIERQKAVENWLAQVKSVVSKFDTLPIQVEGVEPFNLAIANKSQIAKMAETDKAFFDMFKDERSGAYDPRKVIEAATILLNHNEIVKQVYKHGIEQGVIQTKRDIASVNPTIQTQTTAARAVTITKEQAEANLAKAMFGGK